MEQELQKEPEQKPDYTTWLMQLKSKAKAAELEDLEEELWRRTARK
jgi:hypothetical protein